ncbi:unnamed protein product [Cuscuta europaea]|uniref:Uncharacterized protein n=1 Tax=Cuscuta europaea TaxID=41803 RepID=A0A9P1EAP1_CUSEU|nr:unnamed protein product [Cuscuta europaea]
MSKLPPSGQGLTKRKRPATLVPRFVSRVPSPSTQLFDSSSATPPSSTPSLGSSQTTPQVGSSSTSPPRDLSQSTPSPNTSAHAGTDTTVSNNNSEQPLHVIGSIGPMVVCALELKKAITSFRKMFPKDYFSFQGKG